MGSWNGVMECRYGYMLDTHRSMHWEQHRKKSIRYYNGQPRFHLALIRTKDTSSNCEVKSHTPGDIHSRASEYHLDIPQVFPFGVPRNPHQACFVTEHLRTNKRFVLRELCSYKSVKSMQRHLTVHLKVYNTTSLVL